MNNDNLEYGDKIPFTSVENFFDEVTSDYGFLYKPYWYDICFRNPFLGTGPVDIFEETEEDRDSDHLIREQETYDSIEELVHKFKIRGRTLAEIICDENDIPRSVLPVKWPRPTPGEIFYTDKYPELFEKMFGKNFKKHKKNKEDDQ